MVFYMCNLFKLYIWIYIGTYTLYYTTCYEQLVSTKRTKVDSSSIYTYGDYVGSADKTIDGNFNQSFKNCMHTAARKKEAWLRLDLGDIYNLKSVNIWYRNDRDTERLRGFRVLTAHKSNGSLNDYNLCYEDKKKGTLETVLEVGCTKTARYVMIYKKDDTEAILEICEIAIDGCPRRTYGKNCVTCDTCQFECDVTGRCDGFGCKNNTAYHGPYCKACSSGRYGNDCNEECGHCSKNETCHQINGTCPGSCEAGYRGKKCTKKCNFGKFGIDCGEKCGHCLNNETCHHVSGACPGTCETGYIGEECLRECTSKRYGKDCREVCGHCKGDDQCHHISGACPGSCEPGYHGRKCLTKCEKGLYGEKCSHPCGHCSGSGQCDHVDGTCPSGYCEPGWKHINQKCDQECENGTFGSYCQSKCIGHCAGGLSCNKVNGSCPGECEDGWINSHCNETCTPERYGKFCQEKCGYCKNNRICIHTNGSCFGLCQPGYVGDRCLTNQLIRPGYSTASSSSVGYGGYPNKTVDGDFKQNDYKYCMHTAQYQSNAWLRVDLRKIYNIHSVKFWYRNDSNVPEHNTRRVRGFEISLSNTTENGSQKICYQHDGKAILHPILENDCKGVAQFVMISSKRTFEDGVFLEICEVQVFGCSYQDTDGYCIPCNQCKNDCNIHGKCDKQGCKMDGYRPPNCKECKDLRYGTNCNSTCGHCANNLKCNNITGSCPGGTCASGWKHTSDFKCNEACNPGNYGENCQESCGQCEDTKTCHHINGSCPGLCKPGYSGWQCKSVCPHESYGENCSQQCGHCAGPGTCNHISGSCPGLCNPGYQGTKCKTVCPSGNYGENCSQQCGHCAGPETCNHISGYCPWLCEPGYQGDKCLKVCPPERYGENCSQQCGHCEGPETCNHISGSCPGLCKPGYHGVKCKTVCPSERYGENCSQQCGHCAGPETCNHINGSCPGLCNPGYHGVKCKTECPSERYGENCSQHCGQCAGPKTCNHISGSCPGLCNPGYQGVKCKTECDNGTFGLRCNFTCAQGCLSVCNKINGTCDQCLYGFVGEFCNITVAEVQREASTAAAAGIGAFMLILVIIVIVLAIVLARKARQKKEADIHLQERKIVPNNDLQENNIEDIADKTENGSYLEGNGDIEYIVTDNGQKKTLIKIADLGNIIKIFSMEENKKFTEEFKGIPYGEQQHIPCSVAKLQQNMPKNRYKTTFPYDHSRVVLNVSPDNDYINANYIKDVEGKRRYIATQGPRKNTVQDFWAMIWQENIRVIVMVTKLTEGSTIKCEQYWPEQGEQMTSGQFGLQLMSQKDYANYTQRDINLTNTKTKAVKTVNQVQFTAWPDHGTPSPIELLVFYRHVMRFMRMYPECPLVVHCSAGIGRTGTFIALDALYKHGQKEGKIDIVEYVKIMREDRMNMIQNAGQYVFLYKALYEIFKTNGRLLNKEEFIKEVTSQLMSNKAANASQFKKEFNELLSIKPVLDENETKDARQNIDLNMTKTVLPADSIRVLLTSYARGRGNYYNAVPISSYTLRDGLIAAQYPVEGAAIDLVRLLIDQECTILVSINQLSDIATSAEWMSTSAEKSVISPYKTMLGTGRSLSNKLKMTVLKIKHDKDAEWHTVKVLEILNWKINEKLPAEDDVLIELMNKVQEIIKDPDTKIIVLSRDGATGCGIFCAVYNAIQQLQQDNEVDMFTIVRQLQMRRPEMISSMSEYQCCCQVVANFFSAHKDDIYENAQGRQEVTKQEENIYANTSS